MSYTPDDLARHNIAETVRHLINHGIPTASIRKALHQQHAVLGDPENMEPYGAQNHPLREGRG